MATDKLLESLKAKQKAYEQARQLYWERFVERDKAKLALREQEARLIAGGNIEGKNAQEREANLFIATEKLHRELALAERKLKQAEKELDIASEALKTVRAAMNYIAAKESGA